VPPVKGGSVSYEKRKQLEQPRRKKSCFLVGRKAPGGAKLSLYSPQRGGKKEEAAAGYKKCNLKGGGKKYWPPICWDAGGKGWRFLLCTGTN